MAAEPRGSILRQLRRLVSSGAADDASDAQLLERFAALRDEAAFETLVRRHGSMVLGVCRRVLGNGADADDAFQATFLVLMRTGAGIRQRGTVGHWLYVVAYRVALQARARAARRRTVESEAGIMQTQQPAETDTTGELRQVLDVELSRLPERYRAPLVLCYLEGKTNEEAAQLLGWSKRSVTGRLARARDLLHRRLARRSLAFSGLAGLATTESVSAALLDTTLKTVTLCAAGQAAAAGLAASPAITLMNGALKAMWITRIKLAAVLLTATLALTGSGWFLHRALAEKPAEPQAQAPAAPVAAPEALPGLPAAFTRTLDLVKPQAGEGKYAQVPWAETLWDARVEAAAKGKPIFIWVTGGPPGIC